MYKYSKINICQKIILMEGAMELKYSLVPSILELLVLNLFELEGVEFNYGEKVS